MQGVVGSSPSGSTTRFSPLAHPGRAVFSCRDAVWSAEKLTAGCRYAKMGKDTSVNNLRRPCLLPLLLAALYVLWGAALSPLRADPPARGTAIVAVSTDMTDPAGQDQIEIRIAGNTDRTKLLDIALALGALLHAAPGDTRYDVGTPPYITDQSVFIKFTLPMVSRQDGYLPIEPFITALAPYASEIKIGYIIYGPFTYRGIQGFAKNGVNVVVTPPPAPQAGAAPPWLLYTVNITTASPNPGPLHMPHYANEKGAGALWRMIGWILLAGLLGAGLGLLAAKLLMRWKAQAGFDTTPTRGKK